MTSLSCKYTSNTIDANPSALQIFIIRHVDFIVNTLNLRLSKFWLRQAQTLASVMYIWNRHLDVQTSLRWNTDWMISKGWYPILFLKQNNQMIKLDTSMPKLHNNCKENEFTGVIPHLDGIVLQYQPQFQYKWAEPWENVSNGICEKQRRRSACASTQSDQRLYCLLLK